MLDHRVVPVDEGWDPLFPPDEPALVALLGVLEDTSDPLLVGLALQAWEPASFASEADSPGFAHADAIGVQIGAGRQGLGGIRIEMIRHPQAIRLGGERMQRVFRKAELLAERSKGGFACLLL